MVRSIEFDDWAIWTRRERGGPASDSAFQVLEFPFVIQRQAAPEALVGFADYLQRLAGIMQNCVAKSLPQLPGRLDTRRKLDADSGQHRARSQPEVGGRSLRQCGVGINPLLDRLGINRSRPSHGMLAAALDRDERERLQRAPGNARGLERRPQIRRT